MGNCAGRDRVNLLVIGDSKALSDGEVQTMQNGPQRAAAYVPYNFPGRVGLLGTGGSKALSYDPAMLKWSQRAAAFDGRFQMLEYQSSNDVIWQAGLTSFGRQFQGLGNEHDELQEYYVQRKEQEAVENRHAECLRKMDAERKEAELSSLLSCLRDRTSAALEQEETVKHEAGEEDVMMFRAEPETKSDGSSSLAGEHTALHSTLLAA
jgi:hypothetical protein